MILNVPGTGIDPSLEAAVLGRTGSLYEEDIHSRHSQIASLVHGARILVIGGAGSIGSVSVDLLLDYSPAALHVTDIGENGLAELVRHLRSSRPEVSAVDFQTLPIDFGGPIMERLLQESSAYDIVLNFAAVKHVRSEKDVFSLLEMLNTNVRKQATFRTWLDRSQPQASYFAVSTDKAANPTSLMGASKRLMEDVIFSAGPRSRVTSARFANVAFSNGSLLQSFLIRLSKRQLLAAPADTLRYFVSLREAGHICLLAALTAPHQHLVVPRFEPGRHLRKLDEIAEQVMRFYRLEPVRFFDETSARAAIAELLPEGRYPLLITPLDTSGEKPYEEFIGKNERAVEIGLKELLAIPHQSPAGGSSELLRELCALVVDPTLPATKPAIVQLIQKLLPNMHHVETGKSLDQRA